MDIKPNNTFEPNRDVLTNKENARLSSDMVISNFAYMTHDIGQRTNLTTSGTAFAKATVYTLTYNGLRQLLNKVRNSCPAFKAGSYLFA